MKILFVDHRIWKSSLIRKVLLGFPDYSNAGISLLSLKNFENILMISVVTEEINPRVKQCAVKKERENILRYTHSRTELFRICTRNFGSHHKDYRANVMHFSNHG